MARIYRGIVVVHGVGEHRKGAPVSGFVEQLAAYLRHVPGLEGGVELTARNRSDRTDTSWATIHITNPDGTRPDEEWHIREAWWTRTFEPSQPGRVYLWAILAGLALFWAACVQQLARGLLATFAPGRLAKWPTERAGRPVDRATHQLRPESGQGIWLQPGAGRLKSLVDGCVWAILTVLFLLAGVLGLLAIGLVYLVLVLPLSYVLPALANWLVKATMHAIVFTLGDQEAMTTRQVALAASANEVNAGLWNMLSLGGLRTRRKDDAEFTGFETVTVVAHSGGCVVSMAALNSSDFRRFRAETLTKPYTRPARVNLVTAGSGLNLAWNVRLNDSAADRALWERGLDGVNWLNIYSRYDPVPQGPAPVGMLEELLGRDPEMGPPGAVEDSSPPGARPPFVSVRTVNSDSPWADHGGYWGNHPEAMSRIVHVITDAALSGSPLIPEDTAVRPKNLAAIEAALHAAVHGGMQARRVKVARNMAALVASMAVFAAVVVTWADDVGQWALGTGSVLGLDPWAPGGHQLENVAAKKLASFKVEAYRDRIIGAAVIAFVALIALEYARLFRWLWLFTATRATVRARWLWFGGSTVILLATLALLDLLLIRWPTGSAG